MCLSALLIFVCWLQTDTSVVFSRRSSLFWQMTAVWLFCLEGTWRQRKSEETELSWQDSGREKERGRYVRRRDRGRGRKGDDEEGPRAFLIFRKIWWLWVLWLSALMLLEMFNPLKIHLSDCQSLILSVFCPQIQQTPSSPIIVMLRLTLLKGPVCKAHSSDGVCSTC